MASPAPLVALLEKASFFSGLEQSDLERCAQAFTPLRFSAGETLFLRGDVGDTLYVIAEGRVRVSLLTDDGREISVRHAASGALLGEIAVLDGGTRSADATALTTVRAFVIRRDRLQGLMVAMPGLSRGVIAILCQKLRETTDQLEGIALHAIERRLARFLLASLPPESEAGQAWVEVALAFSQTELAQLLGASRPKVNGALGLLEKAGAIRRQGRTIRCHLHQLHRYAGTRPDDV